MEPIIKCFSVIFAVVDVCYSSAFACGEMGNVNRDCSLASDIGSVAKQPAITVVKSEEKVEGDARDEAEKDSVLDSIQDFLADFFNKRVVATGKSVFGFAFEKVRSFPAIFFLFSDLIRRYFYDFS